MGQVRVSLRLSSSDVLSTNLDLTCATNIEADSGSIQRVKVLGTAVGNDAQIIHKPNEKADRAYLYVKNMESVAEHFLFIYELGDNTEVAKLAGGEFCFIPVDPAADLRAFGSKVDQIMEFGSFGLDSSAVRFG
tara:strand:+ start:209 stop:610 length:402 start_codon:yes stop_codon:yes gene_type:complete